LLSVVESTTSRRLLRQLDRYSSIQQFSRALAESRPADAEMELDRLEELSDEKVIEEIVAVRGFGEWSAQMFLIFHLERPDVISGGDLGIRKAIQLADGLEEMPTPAEVVERGVAWRPHRSLAMIYLWESLAGDVTVGGV